MGRTWLCMFGLLVATGCGDSSSDPSSGDGSGSVTGGGSASTATATSTTASTTNGMSSTTPSTSGPSTTEASSSGASVTTETPALCDEFLDETDLGPAVEISVQNDTDAPRFLQLGGCGGNLPMSITDGTGTVFGWQPGDCFPETCEGFIEQGDCSIGCPDCGGVAPLRIEPGDTYTFEWSGGSFTDRELPAACIGGDTCSAPCRRLQQTAPALYTLELGAFAMCDGEACECEGPPSNGACSVGLYPTLAEPVTARAMVQYPDETSVTIMMMQ